MISVAEAIERVAGGFSPLASENIPLSAGLGRVLAEEVTSRITQPRHDVSSMDGYAVRAEDVTRVPVTLKQIGESQAGGEYSGSVGAGETVRIFTGAPLPDGTDAIVIQEDVDADGDTINIKETSGVGRYVRHAGLDFKVGDVLLKAGTVLTARDLGLAAAMNAPWLTVARRPRVAVLATGNEVVMPGEPVGPNQIISSNSISICAYVESLGGEAINLGIARDDEASLRQSLDGASKADLLITIGGASVGDYDLVRKVLGEEGMDLSFYKVAMRPGKPLIFGNFGGVPVLGLPGNPVSAGVTSILFMRPAIEVMLGTWTGEDKLKETAILGADVGDNDKRQDYLRATLSRDADANLVATVFEKQDSSMMANFAYADCLIVRPPFAEPVKAGTRVEIIRLRHGMISV